MRGYVCEEYFYEGVISMRGCLWGYVYEGLCL